MTIATEAELELNESIGPYRLVRAIGSGGSARIDLARIDRAYGFKRHVVIKRPLDHLRRDSAVAASLQREARIGGRLSHPNLVSVLDAGSHDGYDYLVLEYVHGASLRTLMQSEIGGDVRHVPLPVALGIAIDVARGMHEAHELCDESGNPLGLVHRDVSPGNVLLGHDGAVKLADFGIAKETRVTTLSGSMHGTVTYMAPEQCQGHAFDRRADVFSLGVILYELVTHRRLFWADNDVASLHRVLSGHVTRPRELEPSLTSALEDIVMTAVAHEPSQRFASGRELADALEALAANEGIVVGARCLARTLEEAVGAKHPPWIAGTAVMAIAEPEVSLVSVIESLTATDAEPVAAPAPAPAPAPMATPPPRSRIKRRAMLAAITALAVVAIGGTAFVVMNRDSPLDDRPPPLAPPRPVVESAPPTPRVETPAKPEPSPVVVPAQAPASAVPPPVAHNRHHGRPSPSPPPHVAPTAVAPPPAVAVPDSPPAKPVAPPANVEWKPTMLLPTDSGKSK